jgi:excisionase family DNA binding protein
MPADTLPTPLDMDALADKLAALLAAPALMNDAQVARYLVISRRLVWKLVSTGKLPEPIRIGGRLARWRRTDIDGWLAEQAAASVGGAR